MASELRAVPILTREVRHVLLFYMQHVSTCVRVVYVCRGVWSVDVERMTSRDPYSDGTSAYSRIRCSLAAAERPTSVVGRARQENCAAPDRARHDSVGDEMHFHDGFRARYDRWGC